MHVFRMLFAQSIFLSHKTQKKNPNGLGMIFPRITKDSFFVPSNCKIKLFLVKKLKGIIHGKKQYYSKNVGVFLYDILR